MNPIKPLVTPPNITYSNSTDIKPIKRKDTKMNLEIKEIKELEIQKATIEQLFSDGKVADEDIEQKAKELEAIIQKIETKEERWFELSAKIE